MDVVRELISERGADPNAREETGDGRAPLHWAARSGQVDCVRALVELGARATCVDNLGRTPLHYAAGKGHVDCVRGLVELAVLKRIEAAAGAAHAAAFAAANPGVPPPPPLHVCDLFDIIVGTSTGGLLAAGAAMGMPLDELEAVYKETASVIFKPESYSSLLRSACPRAMRGLASHVRFVRPF